ncbi:hypothetical protein JIP0899_1510006 [Flavobacterium psychrophilum]|nr:hypothetical protein JIP0899_1510006 [Flavobacterium psychrophilum]
MLFEGFAASKRLLYYILIGVQ